MWYLILAIGAGFLLKFLVTNPSAKETLYTTFQAIAGKIREANADGGIKFKKGFQALIEYIRGRNDR